MSSRTTPARLGRRDFLHAGAVCTGAAGLSLVGCTDRHDDARALDADVADSTARTADGSMACRPTRDDALGPFFEAGAPMRTKIAADNEPGERLHLTGQVVAEDCTTPIDGVLVDVWQADRTGNYHDAGVEYRLRGQILTGADGMFVVDTIVPGNYSLGGDDWRPAHVHFMFAKPGFVSFATQIYFEGDPYLAPNDGCGACGSDDLERIVGLSGDAQSGWRGAVRIVLARS